MQVVSEERALLLEAHATMRDIAGLFLAMQNGSAPEHTDVTEQTDVELLTEMRDALQAAKEQIGPALAHPMVKQMLKMARR